MEILYGYFDEGKFIIPVFDEDGDFDYAHPMLGAWDSIPFKVGLKFGYYVYDCGEMNERQAKALAETLEQQPATSVCQGCGSELIHTSFHEFFCSGCGYDHQSYPDQYTIPKFSSPVKDDKQPNKNTHINFPNSTDSERAN